MLRARNFLKLTLTLVFLTNPLAALSAEGGQFGDTAPEFPEGQFSDGKQYHVKDYRGQLLVLFFYEQKCPTCKASIKDRNKVVKQFQGKPVQFIAVGAGDSLSEVQAYVNETHLAMPVFADEHSKMEKAYGFRISLNNIYKFRVIGPQGQIVAYDMKPETIEECLANLSSNQETVETDPVQNPEANDTKGKTKTKSFSRDPAVLNNQAVQAINNKDFNTAIEALTELLKIRPGYKVAQENLQIAYTNLGCELANNEKLEEAAAPMKQAYELAEKIFGARDPRFSSALENYAGILQATGREKEAEELRKRLAQ